MDEEKRISGKKNIMLCIISVLLLCILLFPLYWALITSLKTRQERFLRRRRFRLSDAPVQIRR